MQFYKVIKSGQAFLTFAGAVNPVDIMIVEGDCIMANEKGVWLYNRKHHSTKDSTSEPYVITHLLDRGIIRETNNRFD